MAQAQDAGLILYTCSEDAETLAADEIRAVAEVRKEVQLAPGVWLVIAAEGFDGVVAALVANPPIFVRHIAPAQVVVPLTGDAADPAILADRVIEDGRIAARLSAESSFSVQARILGELPYKPFDANKALAEPLGAASGAPLDVRNPQQIISVACTSLPVGWARDFAQLRVLPNGVGAYDAPVFGLVGISNAAENLSSWAGGMRRFAREEGQVSRSEFKLLEAVELFGVPMPARGVALDLGASPGGWTRVLRQHDQYVTAIDPGELDPRVTADKGVRHLRMTAESYLREPPDQFDLIVNDMRMDARDSARMMVAYAPHLYRHGYGVMTAKLEDKATPAEQRKRLQDALTILRKKYQIVGARQLFHNRSEVTVVVRPL